MDKNLFQNKYRVKSSRLKDWDYSTDWYYFVTVCVKDFKKSLGKVEKGKIILNRFGEIVKEELLGLENHYPCEIDKYVIMPNHVHFIIILKNDDVTVETGLKVMVETIHELSLQNRRKMLLPRIIGRLKMQTAKKINLLKKSSSSPFWQKNYYEHIIRNEVSLEKIRLYIRNNPYKWNFDEYN